MRSRISSRPASLAPACAGLVLLAAAAPALAQTTLVFQEGVSPSADYRGAADAIIKEQTPTLNLGAIPRLRVTTADIGGGRTWTLVRWDISGHVPPGCVVTDARLRVYVDPDDPGASTQVYALARPWTEGDGSAGSGVTWTTTDGTTAWASPGAAGGSDSDGTLLATLPGSPGAQEVALNAAGVARVQAWADDPTQNFGLLIRGNSSDAVDYASRENADASRRPTLIVTYELPPFGNGASDPVQVTLRQGQAGYSGTTDTTLYQPSSNSNYGNLNITLTASSYSWSLYRWDLSSIPANATITAASVDYRIRNAPGASFDLHRLLRPWSEGGATWNSTGFGSWGEPGAEDAGNDYDPALLATVPAGSQNQTVSATFTAAGLSAVQGWIDDPSSNYGYVVRRNGSGYAYYASSEDNSSRRPRFNLTYTVPVPGGGTTRTATSPGNWNDPSIWTPAGVPGVDERAILQAAVEIADGGSYEVTRLEVHGSGSLEVRSGTLSVSGLLATLGGGSLSLTGGTLRALGTTLALDTSEWQISSGALRLGSEPCWLGAQSQLSASGGALEGDAAPMEVTANGTLELSGLTIRRPAATGLRCTRYARLRRLRGCSFEAIAPDAGACFLAVEQESLCLNAPGNVFEAVGAGQAAVRATDLDPSGPGAVALNFEWRGTSTNGAGATTEDERQGAAVNWVHAAPDTTAGVAVGFPQVAYDLNTFAYYAVYAAFRDADDAGTDQIRVFDPASHGVDQGYWFEIPASHGDLVGGYWWDQRGSARVVWALTTSGYAFRFTNPGSGSGPIAPDLGFPTQVLDPTPVTFTNSPLTADQSLVFAAGTVGGAPRLFALDAADGSLAWSLAAGLNDPITSKLGSETRGGRTTLYAGGGQILDQSVTIFSEDFDGGPGPFGYRDDAFRGTNNPSDATGDYSSSGGLSGGRVRVTLGNFGTNMSGGWAANFTLPGTSPALVELRFAYRLQSGNRFEFDEVQQVLAAVDGQLKGVSPNDYVLQFTGDGNGGPNQDSGWAQAAFRFTLTPGAHELVLGGFMNKSTEDPEYASMLFDSVEIETIAAQGRLYRVDTQAQVVELEALASGPISGSVFPSPGTGLFAVDENGAVHGIDLTTFAPLSGWPVQTGTALRSDVWLDYFSQQVFFGNETGQLFGYAIDGSALSGWPLSNPFGAPEPVRASPLFDRGVLWAASEGGRVVAVDASAAQVISPDYRLGSALSRVSQDAGARVMFTTACGQLVVLDAHTDPTP